MTSKVKLFSGASVAIGAGLITDVNEDTVQAESLRARYDDVVNTWLASHRWGFAKVKQSLGKLTDPPLDEYSSAFQIPREALAIFRISPRLDYKIYGDRILANGDSLIADFIARVSEGDFPGYFSNALTLELSAQIAIPVTHDAAIARNQKEEALLAWRMARGTDSMQHPTESVDDLPFLWVRSA